MPAPGEHKTAQAPSPPIHRRSVYVRKNTSVPDLPKNIAERVSSKK